ncbi:Crp/Fnr family transcriptional regulator [Kutzneria buriramensis]|uniref:Crp/Fnr family transcriptional regulator n=1 Tax=Kutzneria buriramensis TaxID=1045776 RepID=UPI000E24512B|nr:Crp/Fnr family transcriptional regulator [Kutzneria buriramensis]
MDFETVRAKLRTHGRAVPFRNGDLLCVAGDDSDEVLLIEAGSVKVVLPGQNGVDSILGFYGPGDVLGEMGVLWDRQRSASIVARTHGRAVHVDGARFLALAAEDPEVLRFVTDLLRERLWRADKRLEYRASMDVQARLARVLLDLAREFGEPVGPGFGVRGVTQAELAQLVTASQKSIEHAVHLLRQDGVLITDRRYYQIVDADALERKLADPGWRPGG